MVSFCDLPLSQVKNHITSYGSYGLGLSKEWAKKQKLNPVMYMERDSLLSASYYKAAKLLTSKENREIAGKQSKDLKDSIYALIDVLGYVKNYQGDVERQDGSVIKDYRFYDEREWRYVPKYEGYLWIKNNSAFSDNDKKAKAQEKLEEFRLVFEPNDIKYIIIKDESEIARFVRHLQDAKSKFSYEDVLKVTTRIITLDEINNDI
ncbi:hypothetical protein NB709_000559 [Xanthomonas sacchari]|nr:hypothetical protein [Xanthomonas sacchari]